MYKKITFSRKLNLINFHYNINDFPLEQCNEISNLGIIMDDKSLSFVPHKTNITINFTENSRIHN